MFKTLRAILAQKSRLDDLERRIETLARDSQRRELVLEETRAAIEYLQGDLAKVRGRITGGLKKKGDENGDATPSPDVNELIRQGKYPIRR